MIRERPPSVLTPTREAGMSYNEFCAAYNSAESEVERQAILAIYEAEVRYQRFAARLASGRRMWR